MNIRVSIAGASGFIGQHLIQVLSKDHYISSIKGLCRSNIHSTQEKIKFQECDLFSLRDLEIGLSEIDQAIYLVHSMLPSSELAQGTFEDYDLILADNFARACIKNKVKRIIYLSGIIPSQNESNPELLSKHLKSRLEVEKIFLAYHIPLLSLRAGIVMGLGGSSFEIILRLVKRLPAMICPAWTLGRSNPIHVDDVCETFRFVLSQPDIIGIFDLAGPEILSYRDMIQKCSEHFHMYRFLINFPLFSPKLSRLWVSSLTGAPPDLIYPLIESLQHEMLADPKKTLKIPNWHYKSFKQSLAEINTIEDLNHETPKAYIRTPMKEKIHIVQSVQRMPLPKNYDAVAAAKAYTEFLTLHFKRLFMAQTEKNYTKFYIRITNNPLLILEYSEERSTSDRVLFYIKGGLLDGNQKRARLEFRQCKHESSLIIAIHDYKPSLPWYVYKYSQAFFHLKVMKAFSKYLNSDPRAKHISRI